MKTVWFVEQGEYSDYHVVAVFETQAEAVEFVAHRPDGSLREVKLNTWQPEMSAFLFTFDLNGNIVKAGERSYIQPEPELRVDQSRFDRDKIVIRVNRGPFEKAQKIATDRYLAIRACVDQADAMTARADYITVGGGYELNDAVEVAAILAGLQPAPTPPLSTHGENILKILAQQPQCTAKTTKSA